jgi:hypothetical protein
MSAIRPRRLALPLLVAVALALAGAPVAPASAATTIELSATISNTDGVSQDGVVCLELVGGGGSCGGNFFTDGSWQRTWQVGPNPPGSYLVQVRSTTMDNAVRWYQAGNPSGAALKADATPVVLEEGAPDFSFTMVMPAVAKVSGRVVDTAGNGVPGLPIAVNSQGTGRSTTTGAEGVYDLGYTRPGTSQISVIGAPTYAGDSISVSVPTSGTVVVDDLVVALAGTVSGRVTDAVTGNPIPFVAVNAYTADDPHFFINGGATDADGRYVVEGIGLDPFVLQLSDPYYSGYVRTLNDGGDPDDYSPQTPITIAEGEDIELDQELTPATPLPPGPFNLSGRVTDDLGRPLAGINVTFGTVGATTDRLGEWRIDAPDGTHPLEFAPVGDWSTAFGSEPGWAPATLGPVTVSGGTGADDLDVTLLRVVSNTVPPQVSGVAQVGRTLSATTGTWTAPTGTTYVTSWLRNGAVVGSGASYVVRPADAGAVLQARVTATFGQAVVPALTGTRTVPRLTSAVTARGASKSAGKVRIKVRVTAPGLTPTGTVDVRRGRKVVARDVALVGGRAVVVLKKQPEGRARYRVDYDGSAQTLASRSKSFRVQVL